MRIGVRRDSLALGFAAGLFFAGGAMAQNLSVTTVAGLAFYSGSADGTGPSARFDDLGSVAVDSSGNVYVADTKNDVIRKITPAGVVSTVAGLAGDGGSADGPAASARFLEPEGVAVDASGNIYVADTDNCTIRKITPAGTVSTVAGQALSAGSTDGVGSAARFDYPWGIAVDPSGILYVSDWTGNRIRKITPDGTVTTLAGNGTAGWVDGPGSSAEFYFPTGIAVDPTGNVYVADSLTETVRKITPDGVVSTLAGTASSPGAADGVGPAARFQVPEGVALDPFGNVYVADSGNDAIRRIAPDGTVTTVAGTAGTSGYTDGTGPAALFAYPEGVAVGPSGAVLIADSGNNVVRSGAPDSAPAVPQIQTEPSGGIVAPGQSFTFSVAAGGTGPFAYQWYFDGAPISGATSSSYTVSDAESSNSGLYTVVVTNASGSATSTSAELSVGTVPTIESPPQSQTVVAGSNLTLSVTAANATNYEWTFNGALIPNATSSTLTLTNIGADQAGTYAVLVSNSSAAASPVSATITVTVDARLVNLSTRAQSGPGANALFAGFVIDGSDSKQILLRGIGPSLSSFGVSDPLPSPELELYSSGASAPLATDQSWGGAPTLAHAFVAVGAFSLPSNSADSALLQSLAPGAYSAEVAPSDGSTGVALAEIYDADGGSPSSRLVNISSRALVGTGGNILDAGFVIAGTTPETILVRGVGPGLAQFGVSGYLAEPVLTVYDSDGNPIASATGWSDPRLSLAAAAVGAFPLPSHADSALVLTLPPGSYSAVVSGSNASTGIALVEVYELR